MKGEGEEGKKAQKGKKGKKGEIWEKGEDGEQGQKVRTMTIVRNGGTHSKVRNRSEKGVGTARTEETCK